MGKSQTVGFRYYMPLHFISAICRGPSAIGVAVRDCLFGVVAGEKVAWEGEAFDNSTIHIDAPELFGGDEKEGGIVGDLDLMFGAPDQPINSYLAAQQGDPQSAHRGVWSAVFRDGQVCCNNPYLKPWAFRRRRITGGWNGECWYPEKAPIPLSASSGGGVTGGGPDVPAEFSFNVGQRVLVTSPAIDQASKCTLEMAQAYSFEYEEMDQAYWFWRANESNLTFVKLSGESNEAATLDLISQGWGVGETALMKFNSGGLFMVVLTTDEIEPYAPAGYEWTLDDIPISSALGVVHLWMAPLTMLGENNPSVPVPEGFARYCMNPAHVVYQCITDPNCLGYPTAVIDDDNFREAADKLYAEGLGVSLKWTNQESIDSFIGIICDHAGMILLKDRRTGLFKLRLLRDDYVIDDLRVFSPSNSRIVNLQRPAPADIVNELQVTYTDYRNFKEATVPARDTAAIQAIGRVVSKAHSLTGLPNEALAIRCGMRDLAAMSTPLWRMDIEFLRDADDLELGEPFVIDYPPSEIFPNGLFAVMRAADEVNYGSAAEGAITAKCVQDVFSLPDTGYVGVGPAPTPDATPLVAEADAFEVTYRDLAASLTQAQLIDFPADAGFVAAIASRPGAGQRDFRMDTRLDPADFADADTGTFSPSAALSAAIAPGDSVLALEGWTDFRGVEIGDVAIIGEGSAAEWLRVDAAASDGSTLTVGRGCVDTVPQAWPAGTRIWLYEGYAAVDPTQYISGESVDVKVRTRSSDGDILPLADAVLISVDLAHRADRPYPDGNLTLNGLPFYEATAITPTPPGGGGGGSSGGGGPSTPPAIGPGGTPASPSVGPDGGYPDDAPYPIPEPTTFGSDVIDGGDFSDAGDISNWRDGSGNPLDSRWSIVDGRLCFFGTGNAAAFYWPGRRTLAQQLLPHYSFEVSGDVECDAGAQASVGAGLGFSTSDGLSASTDLDAYAERPMKVPAEYGEPTTISQTYTDKRAGYGTTANGQTVISIVAPAVLAVVEGPAARVYFDNTAMEITENAPATTPQTIDHLNFDAGLTGWVQFPPASALSPSPTVSGGEVTFTPVSEYGVHKYLICEDEITDLDTLNKWAELLAEVHCDDPTVFGGLTRGGVGLQLAVKLAGEYNYTPWSNPVERGDWTERRRWVRQMLDTGGATFHYCLLFKCAVGYTASARNLAVNVTTGAVP